MSRDSLKAAKIANDEGFFRTAISRAYYSAYAALAGEFVDYGNIDFKYGGNNPGHQQIIALVANNLNPRQYSEFARREIKTGLRTLQAMRINADYNPEQLTSTAEGSLIALRNATSILHRLEVL